MAILSPSAASDVIRNAEKLGFSTDIADRQQLIAHEWSELPNFMPTMQDLVPGTLRQITPVHICTQGFIGFQVDGESDPLIQCVHRTNQLQEQAQLLHAEEIVNGIGLLWRSNYAYFQGTLRATSFMSLGLLRGGFLCVSDLGVGLIGLRPEWCPTLRDDHGVPWLRQPMPPGSISHPFLREFVSFDDLEIFYKKELVRPDGLVCLSYGLEAWDNWIANELNYRGTRFEESGSPDCEDLKRRPGQLERFNQVCSRFESFGSRFSELALRCFVAMHDQLANGIPSSAGTCIGPDGPRKVLFNRSLGLAFKSRSSSVIWGVESNYQDIDTAFEDIRQATSNLSGKPLNSPAPDLPIKKTATPRKPVAKTKSTEASDDDIVTQLERLTTLHNSGMLDDEEFAAAKRRLLG